MKKCNIKLMAGATMFIWSDESIQWYMRAAEHSRFFDDVANELREVTQDDTICEIGCGPGYLSLAMAPYARKITAVDIDKRVIDVLQNKKNNLAVNNIEAVNSDWRGLDRMWDNVIVSNFGEVPEDIPPMMEMCTKRLIFIRRINNNSFFDLKELHDSFSSCGYSYSFKQRTLEFGQPFVSTEEAERYFLHYNKTPECLVHSQNKEKYPFYCRSVYTTAFFIVQK